MPALPDLTPSHGPAGDREQGKGGLRTTVEMALESCRRPGRCESHLHSVSYARPPTGVRVPRAHRAANESLEEILTQ
jgi:hypothetical protein